MSNSNTGSSRPAPAMMSEESFYTPPQSPMTSPTKRPTAHTPQSDRHIPNRETQNAEVSHYMLTQHQHNHHKENATPESAVRMSARSGNEEPYTNMLARTLFPEDGAQGSVLGLDQFTAQTDSSMNRYNNSLGVVYHANRCRNFTSPSFRVIPQTPERILDAPELIDDFYLNLVEWGSQNILTVALSQTVYLWNADNGDIQQLMSTEDRNNVVTGVCWHGNGDILAIGTNNSEIQIWDTKAQRLIRTIKGHTGRVGCMGWNGNILASGSRDSTIRLHDLRQAPTVAVHSNGHMQEVCGLRWSPNGAHLASGGNDNLLNIWDFRRETNECQPLWQLRQHCAAVKALAWNPVLHGLLASGGGTADKTLRFWDVATGECLHSVDTRSQVCGALWSHNGMELCTSHGYSDNQLTLWKYPSLKRVADLTGHSSRVLHLSQSPNGEVVVSAAGDETIRFWRCFGAAKRPRSSKENSGDSPGSYRRQGAHDMSHSSLSSPPGSPYSRSRGSSGYGEGLLEDQPFR